MKVTVESTIVGEGTPPVSDRPTHLLSAGASIDRYVIERHLGAGGMGIVYVARDPALDRRVAIKLLHRGASAARLRREAKALAKLDHPNVVDVYDVGVHEDQSFVAMALVEGANLREWGSVRRPVRTLIRALVDVGRGVAAAHAAGLIHRDLKPDNVFVSTSGAVKVGDFGLARAADDEPDPMKSPPLGASANALTFEGSIVGTPAYMAPEQARGDVSTTSDQFAFCVLAWELLYGARPFTGETFDELIAAIERGAIIEPEDGRGVPARVRRVLERGLAADPARRWPSMTELVNALDGDRARTRRIAIASAVAALAALAVVFGVARLTSRSSAPTCTSSAEKLAPHWSAERRAAIRASIVEIAPFAGAAADVTLKAFENYGAEWRTAWDDTCKVADSQQRELQRACLEGGLEALVSRTAVLETLDRTTAGDALMLAARDLPDLRRCQSAGARIGAPPPAISREVARIRAGLEHGKALASVLRIAEAIPILETTDREARAVDYPPLHMETAGALASAYNTAQRFGDSDRELGRALALATSLGLDEHVAAFQAQGVATFIDEGQLDRATAAATVARAAIARVGDPPRLVDQLARSELQLHILRGEYAAARAMLPGLIASMRRRSDTAYDVSSLLVLNAMLGSLSGDPTGAAEVFEDALSGVAALHGPRSPGYANLLRMRALHRLLNDEVASCAEDMRTAHQIMVEVMGLDDMNTVELEGQLAAVDALYCDYAKAIAGNRHAIEVKERFGARFSSEDERRVLADALIATGALADAETVLAGARSTNAVDAGMNVAYIQLSYARLHLAKGQLAEAERAVADARPRFVAMAGDQPRLLDDLNLAEAHVHLAARRYSEAAESANKVIAKAYQGEAQSIAAKALAATGDHTAARAARERGLSALDALGPTACPELRAELTAGSD